MSAPTLTEALAAAGYGHRKPTEEDRAEVARDRQVSIYEIGRRVIFRADTGEVVGWMSCTEAWAFLRAEAA